MPSKKICTKNMSFDECELAILRLAVDTAQEKIAKRVVASPAIKDMTEIVEQFIKKKGLIPYGGIAINNILPKDDQFYDEETDIPDYDFFSPNAMDDAKELADIYQAKGYDNVEAKAGQHFGTYKVFVQFIPVADITSIPKPLFKTIKDNAITVDGIPYTPPNFLRMSMFLELSRPAGDTSRWEKVYKRLRLLNKHYPLKSTKCEKSPFQRPMEFSQEEAVHIFEVTRDTLINQGVVFFGGYAISQYSHYMPKKLQKTIKPVPDFDVLSNEPRRTAEILRERLKEADVSNVTVVHHKGVGEIIPNNFEVKVGKDTICYVYEPVGCHSYNIVQLGTREIKIATIDTMLSFYLAFLYGYDKFGEEYADRVLCMSQFLFDVQQKNRLSQKGLLKRFSIACYGHQETKEEMRAEKAKVFEELKSQKGTRLYEEHFLSYKPGEKRKPSSNRNSKTKKSKMKKTVKKKKVKPLKSKSKKKHTRKSSKLRGGVTPPRTYHHPLISRLRQNARAESYDEFRRVFREIFTYDVLAPVYADNLNEQFFSQIAVSVNNLAHSIDELEDNGDEVTARSMRGDFMRLLFTVGIPGGRSDAFRRIVRERNNEEVVSNDISRVYDASLGDDFMERMEARGGTAHRQPNLSMNLNTVRNMETHAETAYNHPLIINLRRSAHDLDMDAFEEIMNEIFTYEVLNDVYRNNIDGTLYSDSFFAHIGSAISDISAGIDLLRTSGETDAATNMRSRLNRILLEDIIGGDLDLPLRRRIQQNPIVRRITEERNLGHLMEFDIMRIYTDL